MRFSIRTLILDMAYRMKLKFYLSSVLKLCISGIGLVLTFYTAINFTLFLSYPNYQSNIPTKGTTYIICCIGKY